MFIRMVISKKFTIYLLLAPISIVIAANLYIPQMGEVRPLLYVDQRKDSNPGLWLHFKTERWKRLQSYLYTTFDLEYYLRESSVNSFRLNDTTTKNVLFNIFFYLIHFYHSLSPLKLLYMINLAYQIGGSKIAYVISK